MAVSLGGNNRDGINTHRRAFFVCEAIAPFLFGKSCPLFNVTRPDLLGYPITVRFEARRRAVRQAGGYRGGPTLSRPLPNSAIISNSGASFHDALNVDARDRQRNLRNVPLSNADAFDDSASVYLVDGAEADEGYVSERTENE